MQITRKNSQPVTVNLPKKKKKNSVNNLSLSDEFMKKKFNKIKAASLQKETQNFVNNCLQIAANVYTP